MSQLYMSWFHIHDVIVIYPVYLMNPATQTYKRVGYRAGLNSHFRREYPRFVLELNSDNHSLSSVCSYVREFQTKHELLRGMRVIYVDQDDAENAQQMDLTTEEAMLLSILRIG